MHRSRKVTLLAGGVGAARLARGLARLVKPENLTIVVNTGDDERFHGLHVSPDLDTIMYSLAGLAPWSPGWGIKDDTFTAKHALERLGAESWFALGDRDLATHIRRTQRLSEGAPLSRVTAELCAALGVRQRILPMSDDAVRTVMRTSVGALPFQDYLVKRRARPRVQGVSIRGASKAGPAPGVLRAIRGADTVIIAPSNPLVSIGPMLSVKHLRVAMQKARAKTVAVSPIINGRAVKGPLVSMLRGIGKKADNASIASLYARVASTLVVALHEAPVEKSLRGWPVFAETDTLMSDELGAERLARTLLELGEPPACG